MCRQWEASALPQYHVVGVAPAKLRINENGDLLFVLRAQHRRNWLWVMVVLSAESEPVRCSDERWAFALPSAPPSEHLPRRQCQSSCQNENLIKRTQQTKRNTMYTQKAIDIDVVSLCTIVCASIFDINTPSHLHTHTHTHILIHISRYLLNTHTHLACIHVHWGASTEQEQAREQDTVPEPDTLCHYPTLGVPCCHLSIPTRWFLIHSGPALQRERCWFIAKDLDLVN